MDKKIDRVPTVVISHRKGHAVSACEATLNKKALELLQTNEVLFIRQNGDMKLQLPQFDSNRVYKIYNHTQTYKGKKYMASSAKFFISFDDAPDVIGKYEIEKEEDDFFLVKMEANA